MKTNLILQEVAWRARQLREDSGFTVEEAAKKTGFSVEDFVNYEKGEVDIPFSFINECANLYGVEMMELLEGSSPRLTGYAISRSGDGAITSKEEGIEIRGIAPLFKNRKADPYWCTYKFNEEEDKKPLHQVSHLGQEYDIVLEGALRIKIGDHEEILHAGDSIYYDSSKPHGIAAAEGKDVTFIAVIMPEDGEEVKWENGHVMTRGEVKDGRVIPVVKKSPNFVSDFIVLDENEDGTLNDIKFKNTDQFNFSFDVVDAIAEKEPDRLCMLHLDVDKNERRFTFQDMAKLSARAANYFKAKGIKKGDKVMLLLRRNWEFWPIIVGLGKIGAVAIPATDQLLEKDLDYRFKAAGVKAVCCTAFGKCWQEIDKAAAKNPSVELKFMCGGVQDGWMNFDEEYDLYSSRFRRSASSIHGEDTMLMLFSSGTSGYPKAVEHSCKYPLGHFMTARYWHCTDPDGIHFTISDTGWGKSLWGKLFGQWMNGGATFVYDFDRFHADDILPLIGQYKISTLCCPPTMYRFFIKEDLSKYDLSSIKHATIAGEAMNPEVFEQFKKATGLSIMEGFGQTETTLTVGNLIGMTPKPGSMGKPSPMYEIELHDPDGQPVAQGETGEIVIKYGKNGPCGLLKGYYGDPEATKAVKHDGWFHTGDLAWRDEDGYFWYVGRSDDIIKSSGYRIGPFEIESVIMELPYVLECGVSAVPDEIRGQIVKASIILVKGTEGTEELKKEIQNYVKKRTAPYKYPRLVEFRDELPKTISGKIIRNKL